MFVSMNYKDITWAAVKTITFYNIYFLSHKLQQFTVHSIFFYLHCETEFAVEFIMGWAVFYTHMTNKWLEFIFCTHAEIKMYLLNHVSSFQHFTHCRVAITLTFSTSHHIFNLLAFIGGRELCGQTAKKERQNQCSDRRDSVLCGFILRIS